MTFFPPSRLANPVRLGSDVRQGDGTRTSKTKLPRLTGSRFGVSSPVPSLRLPINGIARSVVDSPSELAIDLTLDCELNFTSFHHGNKKSQSLKILDEHESTSSTTIANDHRDGGSREDYWQNRAASPAKNQNAVKDSLLLMAGPATWTMPDLYNDSEDVANIRRSPPPRSPSSRAASRSTCRSPLLPLRLAQTPDPDSISTVTPTDSFAPRANSDASHANLAPVSRTPSPHGPSPTHAPSKRRTEFMPFLITPRTVAAYRAAGRRLNKVFHFTEKGGPGGAELYLLEIQTRGMSEAEIEAMRTAPPKILTSQPRLMTKAFEAARREQCDIIEDEWDALAPDEKHEKHGKEEEEEDEGEHKDPVGEEGADGA
eukprot:CAMPEP_0113687806 /NCGR_PEP_ID=MMETSP0038_2-20120614/16157_1 /TAXON_ID=2898 /ORGANISM="Cryptomonas paramecium" /LENGTH=371 /DNA_ID=CAMNT_0000608495 /DNA_START=78 /DNA_END=1189 /DNA_ORIENTATION=- /assembly_acc=CAM_ASM_000170